MPDRPRIALIHATRVAMAPVEAAIADHWPEAEAVSILEEALSIDRAKSESLSEALSLRIVALAAYAERIGADGILFTCSAFGAAIERAARNSRVPVLKPNEAMFDAAFQEGDRVAMIYTFPPSAGGMEEEFRREAARRGRSATITSVFCDGALDAKKAGDDAAHDSLIAETAAQIADADVILLAQFSMANAAALPRSNSDIPILTSPGTAVRAIRQRVEAMAS